jgi:hypothetical protein
MKMKIVAIVCVCLLLVSVIAVVYIAPQIQLAAHKRSLGRGTQTIMELLWPRNDLFDNLATVSGSLVDGDIVFDQNVTLKYAGPYAIRLETTNVPSNPLPELKNYPSISISITPPSGHETNTEVQKLISPYWGRSHGFLIHHFDAPGEIPLDLPINIKVTVKQPTEEFVAIYGTEVEIVLGRISSQ